MFFVIVNLSILEERGKGSFFIPAGCFVTNLHRADNSLGKAKSLDVGAVGSFESLDFELHPTTQQ